MYDDYDIKDIIANLDSDLPVQQNFHKSQLYLKPKKLVMMKHLDHNFSNENTIDRIMSINNKLYAHAYNLFAVILSITDEYYPIISMDYYCGKDLGYVLDHQNKHKLTQTQKLIIAYGITKALLVLKQLNLVHPNFKLSKILIDENYYPYISDVCTPNRQYESVTFADNIKTLISIFKQLDSKCDKPHLFTNIIENYELDEGNMTIEQIYSQINDLVDNRNQIDLNALNDYQLYISSNNLKPYHGKYDILKQAGNNGLENAFETMDSIIETLIDEELLDPDDNKR